MRVTVRPWTWVGVLMLVGVAAIVAGGSSPIAQDDAPLPEPTVRVRTSPAELRTDLVVPEPTVAAPGGSVEVHFPEGTARGMLLTLEQPTDEGWAVRYFLGSNGGRQAMDPGWWTPGSDDAQGILDIELGGPGPDLLRLPDDPGSEGEYRLCTANAGEDLCTLLYISHDGLACASDMRESAHLDYETDPEPAGSTAAAAAEQQLVDDFPEGSRFEEQERTSVDVRGPEGHLIGTATMLETTGGFVVSSYTRCGG